MRPQPAPPGHPARLWEGLLLWVASVLLALASVVFAVRLATGATTFEPWRALTVLTLVGASAALIYWGHTCPTMRGEQPRPNAVGYFFTLLVLGSALVLLDDSFVVFLITGFFHAHILASWRAGLFGIFVTSFVINGITLLRRPTISTQDVAFAGMSIIVQTAAIGAGLVITLQTVKAEEKRDELVARLQAALDENAGLHAQLVVQAREAGVHDERGRLAREIHDTIAQGLAGVITQLHAAQGARDQQDSAARVESALLLAKSSLDEARRSVKALQPRELGHAQLPEALRTLAATWQETNGVPVHVEITGEPVALSPALDVSLFRVSQEALTNVAKHAQASRVALTLSYGDQDVLLDIRDDGRGMHGTTNGFGLTSMRQRIRGIGGDLAIESELGEGTAISASVPILTATAEVAS